ncbi:prenyltransferase/squalene oxidase repeat-containing protein [Gaoshiqia sp. Z1-71]|uniref:prenyltransferase/squalene oxidase repeat-containing protein n=1 Tax=Gaoshiqia hydrogeniformans TaxID=3290090 RepID=UPI003BF8A233
MTKQDLEKRFKELSGILLQEMNPQGFWTGELSSSALGVAVAVAALHFHDAQANRDEIRKGLDWLQQNVNADGSFGDTPASPGNVSTSLLVYAAANLYAATDEKTAVLQEKITAYLSAQGIDVRSPQVAEFILGHYQKDYTFSVPILTMCGLCGVPGDDAFQYVPQLPFELSLVPRKFYRLLKLSVVSYAIPALVAVGIVVFKKKKSNVVWRFLRKGFVGPALSLLRRLMSESGGFLEAIPLTAFVSLSLIEAGFGGLEVVEKGIAFLKRTQRADGSWPIDIDLSTWVTTLAVKSLRGRRDEALKPEMQSRIAGHLNEIQNLEIHPFNGAHPGGWGWTSHSGSVPDGDDTPGAILALLQLQPKQEVKHQVLAACEWLLQLQNSDGGIPTFSKGWGKLPFDQSCADLTGHCLLAISACLDAFGQELDADTITRFSSAVKRMGAYLKKHQQIDGSWLPLWFGNQYTSGQINPVYGTARVLTYLHDVSRYSWPDRAMREQLQKLMHPAEQFLLAVQNEDGSWGGDQSVSGSLEETALAVSALSGSRYNQVCSRGLDWLDAFFLQHGLKASPIGLYFASLWYDEKLYPLTAYLEAVVRTAEIEDPAN